MSIREGLRRLHIALAALFGLAFVTTVLNFRQGRGGLDALLVWACLNILYWAVAWIVAGFLKDKDRKLALMRLPADETDEVAEGSDTDRPAPIARMPERRAAGDQRSGRAVGQWTFMVRCECGKRWFDVKEIVRAKCPRCGLRVHVDRDAGGPAWSEPKSQHAGGGRQENPPRGTQPAPKIVPYIDIAARPGNDRIAAARYPKLHK